MPSRRAGSLVPFAVALLLVAASGVAAGHAAVLFTARDLSVDAEGSVDVGVTFHDVDRVEFRLEGPDGFRLSASVENGGDAGATLELDAAAAGRGDAGAAVSVAGATLRDASVEGAPGGALPAGTYRMTLVTRGITVDRGTLTVERRVTPTDAPTPDPSGADDPGDAPTGTATAADTTANATAAGATTADSGGVTLGTTATGGPGPGPLGALVAVAACLLAYAAAAVRTR
ncbi:hypothetical protein [Candidatus Halobonum tyrrellensis]|uniref:Uncharacterized protein n=1 Tax=Candidatus Halobonum tyrrellensis G22 TaxID=1324957 RepID=V4HD55_9EURY|nr:hypothetical protein [Candidatus Halobonum tyrrellensis]ESP88650.1 hypothetical protein K933_08043 [Candidatus Halobonum tyrrellensis G22]